MRAAVILLLLLVGCGDDWTTSAIKVCKQDGLSEALRAKCDKLLGVIIDRAIRIN